MSMQGSAMMYVTAANSSDASGRASRQLDDELTDCPLDERRLREHLIEAGGVRGAQPGRVGVVREAEDRDVRIRVRDLLRVDARDVGDARGRDRRCGRP